MVWVPQHAVEGADGLREWKVMDGQWKVSGRPVEGQWKVSGRPVEGQWKASAVEGAEGLRDEQELGFSGIRRDRKESEGIRRDGKESEGIRREGRSQKASEGMGRSQKASEGMGRSQKASEGMGRSLACSMSARRVAYVSEYCSIHLRWSLPMNSGE